MGGHRPSAALGDGECGDPPGGRECPLVSSARFAMEIAEELGPDVIRWRSEVIQEMEERIEQKKLEADHVI